jgi:tRNA-specific 2-thiouridylase
MKNNIPSNPKVFLGMSGGVDSSTAALLLKKQGFEVFGLYMRLWKEKDSLLEMKARTEEENARRVAKELGIKFRVVDLRKEFKEAIVDYFVSEYERGRTPNPCVRCNREIKFGLLFKKAMELGADYFATGHYARVRKTAITSGGRKKEVYRLLKAKDISKDQSYFLYNLDQKILQKTFFPLGEYAKTEVREIARDNGLSVHDKAESQEVCFIADKYYGEFLMRMKAEMRPGEIVDEEGRVLGEHRGLPLYTLGQRRDIRIGGTGPYFVIGMDRKANRLIVSRNGESKRLFAKKFALCDVNWVAGKPEKLPFRVRAKTRYRMEAVEALIWKEKGRIVAELEKKSRAVMPGQSAVFYIRNEVIGGGVIDRILE